MRLFVAIACLAALALASAEDRKLYNGHQVFRVTPLTERHLQLLNEMTSYAYHKGSYDFFQRPVTVGRSIDVRVEPSAIHDFTATLRKNHVLHQIHIEDLQKHIDMVDAINMKLRENKPNADIVGTFASHADTNAWLQQQCQQYPNITVCGTWGMSYQNRDMQFIKIASKPAFPVSPRKAIYIYSGMHAREWLGPSTLVWIINQMLTQYGKDPVITTMINTFDFYYEPIVNPDGYEYSRATDRMWRKTRGPTSKPDCVGVDGNRNFDYKWTGGGDPCDEDYGDTAPMTQKEVQNIDAWIKKQNQTQVGLAFISVHTYSSIWLLPYGYAKHAYPADYNELLRVGTLGVNALMAVHNTQWQIGNIVDLLYVATGSSADYFKGHGFAKYSYGMELRGTDFVVPESEIVPSGEEVLAGFLAAFKAMKQ